MYRGCIARSCNVLNLDSTCLTQASAILRPQKKAAWPHYITGGGLGAGLGILEKRKISCFAVVRSPGGHEWGK